MAGSKFKGGNRQAEVHCERYVEHRLSRVCNGSLEPCTSLEPYIDDR